MPSPSVLTLADLKDWSFAGTALAVLGHPIGHSLSPAMHNAALAREAKNDARYSTWTYFRFDVPPKDLKQALGALYAAGFAGVNLTVPHKVLAVPMVTKISPAAKAIGAVNTLKRAKAGFHGFNTDGYGLAASLRQSLKLRLKGKDIILLGAGGAARSAAVEALLEGCRSLWIANRTAENLVSLLWALKPVAKKTPVIGFAPDKLPTHLPRGAIVINATSAGLHPSDRAPIDLRLLPKPAAVFDMIYNPPETKLLAQARKLGIRHDNGLGMLVHQGAKALEIWTAIPASRTAPTMARAVRRPSA